MPSSSILLHPLLARLVELPQGGISSHSPVEQILTDPSEELQHGHEDEIPITRFLAQHKRSPLVLPQDIAQLPQHRLGLLPHGVDVDVLQLGNLEPERLLPRLDDVLGAAFVQQVVDDLERDAGEDDGDQLRPEGFDLGLLRRVQVQRRRWVPFLERVRDGCRVHHVGPIVRVADGRDGVGAGERAGVVGILRVGGNGESFVVGLDVGEFEPVRGVRDGLVVEDEAGCKLMGFGQSVSQLVMQWGSD